MRRAAQKAATLVLFRRRHGSAAAGHVCTITEPIGQPTPVTHPHLMPPEDVTVGIPLSEYTRRRAAFAASLPKGSTAVLNAYPTKIMTHDIPWPFRQESNFWFLTGCLEPNAVALIDHSPEGRVSWRLFVAEKDPSQELWTGVMTGVHNAKHFFNPDASHPLAELASVLKAEVAGGRRRVFLHSAGNNPHEQLVKSLCPGYADAGEYLRRARSRKHPPQIEMHSRSAAITKAAFERGMGATKPGVSEWTINSVMEHTARLEGAQGLAYPPVIAGGKAGMSLHYVANNQLLNSGDLLLVDAGAEFHGHPTDVTRTWPVDGKFTEPQRHVYAAVLNVQKRLLSEAKPGASVMGLHRNYMTYIAEELLALGILDKSFGDAAAQARTRRVTSLSPHAFGHYMGMDIHESVSADDGGQHLQPQMMHTIEPGVYLPDSPSVPPRYRNICVRIEDNILITETGNVVMTADIPKEIDEVEACVLAGA
ncbi:putative Xaa-Pro aminopeptidase 3 [Diplonema papillatum]|nr:putative Xaa-Pro aminopeptidase 3 [Diplonema papillatum]